MKYAVMAASLLQSSRLETMSKEDRDAAMKAANAFRIVEDFLERNAPCVITLEVLIEAEETYKRLVEDAS
jgi:hypothetical protein